MEVSGNEFQSLVEQLLGSGVSVRFSAHGGSMEPEITDDDIVTVAPLGELPVQPGEIILIASHKEGLMVHRIISLDGEGKGSWVHTQGDASKTADKPIGPDEILGRVIRIERPPVAVPFSATGPVFTGTDSP